MKGERTEYTCHPTKLILHATAPGFSVSFLRTSTAKINQLAVFQYVVVVLQW